jgi:hypothetical protein
VGVVDRAVDDGDKVSMHPNDQPPGRYLIGAQV